MASNSFGNLFKITTFGESHGQGIGVVIDGVPAGLVLDLEHLQRCLDQRAPGRSQLVTPRKEQDQAQVLSGLFEGTTTGAPLTIFIANQDQDPSKYEPIKDLLRPGHANFTYLEKYGLFDYQGGGRSSARETAARVAAGAVAKQLLMTFNIQPVAYLQQVEEIACSAEAPASELQQRTYDSELFCPEHNTASKIKERILAVKAQGDSVAGIVAFAVDGLPVGLGDPVYEKLEANLAKAMLSIPASKGFEIGEGFNVIKKRGSTHNDAFVAGEDTMSSNHHGGTLGGISSGTRLFGRVAFKPTSSIKKAQATTTNTGETATFKLPDGSRHDPCVAIRAVPVVEAMLAITLADHLLMNQVCRLESLR